jgi:hypothetical protein
MVYPEPLTASLNKSYKNINIKKSTGHKLSGFQVGMYSHLGFGHLKPCSLVYRRRLFGESILHLYSG